MEAILLAVLAVLFLKLRIKTAKSIDSEDECIGLAQNID